LFGKSARIGYNIVAVDSLFGFFLIGTSAK